MSHLVRLKGVSKEYLGRHVRTKVLELLSLDIERNGFLVVVGKSGSGKSTLLNIIGLLDRVNEGEVIFDDTNVSQLTSAQYAAIRNASIGFVFQDFKLIPDMTVYENIEVPLAFSPKKWSKARRKEKISKMLHEMELTGKEKAYPDELSGGQKQRVSIARALINEPKLLIADEPTGNLDEQTATKVMELFSELHRKKGITIVIVTHDPSWGKYATRMIDLKTLQSAQSAEEADDVPVKAPKAKTTADKGIPIRHQV